MERCLACEAEAVGTVERSSLPLPQAYGAIRQPPDVCANR